LPCCPAPGASRFTDGAGGVACPVLRFAGGPRVLADGEGKSGGHGQSADVGRIACGRAEFAGGGGGRRRCRRTGGGRGALGGEGGPSALSREPSSIVLACADDGVRVEGLTWSAWTATGAAGHGTLLENQCVPNCAHGKFPE